MGSVLPAFPIHVSHPPPHHHPREWAGVGQLQGIALAWRHLAHFLPHLLSPSSHPRGNGAEAFAVPLVLLVPLRDLAEDSGFCSSCWSRTSYLGLGKGKEGGRGEEESGAQWVSGREKCRTGVGLFFFFSHLRFIFKNNIPDTISRVWGP